jgi:hypothetical protein
LPNFKGQGREEIQKGLILKNKEKAKQSFVNITRFKVRHKLKNWQFYSDFSKTGFKLYFLRPEKKYTFSLKINNFLPKQANLTK